MDWVRQTVHSIIANMTPDANPELGSRVVVRYRLEDGLHDALGILLEKAPTHVVIDTRRGRVKVDARTMVTGKQVPPPPQI